MVWVFPISISHGRT